MTKQKIQLIIAFMSVALLGLIVFQFYWFRNAYQTKKELFGVTVEEAMQQAVRGMEKQEILYLTAQKVASHDKERMLLEIGKTKSAPVVKPKKPTQKPVIAQINDSEPLRSEHFPAMGIPSDVLMRDFRQIPESEINFIEQFFRSNQSVDWQLRQLQQARVENEKQFESLVIALDNQMRRLVFEKDSVDHTGVHISVLSEGTYQTNATPDRKIAKKKEVPITAKKAEKPTKERGMREMLRKLENKTALMKDVFKEVVARERKPSDRVNRFLLDSLLKKELQNRGISIPYEYAVKTAENPAGFLFTSTALTTAENQLVNGGYRASLFPNDLFSENNHLFVYFPTQEQFLLGSMSAPLLSSAVLILVILTCFYIAVNTIMRQKKLADIKNDFINNMTHELKTPVSTISLACEMLQDRTVQTMPAMFGRYLSIIQEENRRLGQQVERVLQTALLEKGELKLKLAEVNIHEVIEKALENSSPQIEAKNGIVDLDLQAETPIIEADEVHLTNIVFNLLDNANKYSPECPKIKIETRDTHNGVMIRVSDKGMGMSKESLKHIFEKFYRVPTGNLHDVKGFGLGLSYVKKMVEEHQGTVHVESQLGLGSMFEIVIPSKQQA